MENFTSQQIQMLKESISTTDIFDLAKMGKTTQQIATIYGFRTYDVMLLLQISAYGKAYDDGRQAYYDAMQHKMKIAHGRRNKKA